ncbi:CDP-diacylglycerol--serine O-phosphatidyltransferase [Litorilinea aerophila]|uniref:CDP-diacylglycerol--serine O-phosphatidyltransferase n=1 Tax=Litorilinea aerophila TaxID=1204385 RepID=A0A540VB24_9CHLR|nr:CDP-diacylglycerol--serine O-phosphatidyltransferase [Litorilinea aerophila]MCC9078221.1 CDP-diacylglycerol--serine O-phosphatidyltransferase [Litorilinea aerophila]GIV80191.1 MAG: CDP-diacylglycerol--serine O-phosphatidyltransferase [Litorilinea sp.]
MTDQEKLSSPHPLHLLLPSTATLGSLFLGIAAITVLADQRFVLGALFILAGSVLDAVDGQLAHRLNATTDIGKQLDSLADMVTFGVAPTILIYYLMLGVGVHPTTAIFASVIFALAGACRLARYNTQPTCRSAFFTGMPIPVASMLLIAGSFWQHWTLNLWWTVVVAVVSFLMVSPFPYPKLKHVATAPIPWLAVPLLAAIWAWIWGGWQVVPFTLLSLYAVMGPLYGLQQRAERRRQQMGRAR